MISKLSSYLGPASLFSGSAPSLVLYLDAGNTFSYSGAGNTWYDLTSLNNDIELSNTTFNATYSNLTNFKGSFEFGGTNSFGSLITGTAIPLMDSHYTIEAWIQSNSYETLENGGIIGWGNYGTDYESNALKQSGLGFTNYWWNNDLLTTPATASVDYWYHIAATYDGTNRTIYLNGESLGTDVPGVSHSVETFSNLKIGVTADYLDEYFNGRISTIKVWNKSLNSTQLLSTFNSNKSKYGYDFGSMTFDETQSSYLISSSTDYAFGTNDFTVELFFKSTNEFKITSRVGIISSWINGYPKGTPFVYIDIESGFSPTQPQLIYPDGSIQISHDVWYHVAISRTSGTSSLFLNGDLIDVFSDTSDYTWTDLVVGRRFTNLDSSYFNGIISNVRVINGTGLYTGKFSVPSTPLSGDEPNTKLLISSQEMSPNVDLTGLNRVFASNIGWTSSIPYIAPTYITDHLELYVDAGVLSSYPGSKNTLYDLSPNGFNMTIGTGSTWSSKLGGVIDFDGSYLGLDGPVSTNSVVSVTHSTGFTMETMVKFNNINGEGIFSFNGGRFANSRYINLTLDRKTDEIIWYVNNGSGVTGNTYIRPTYTFNTGTWYHIVATHDTNFLVVYVNGIMIGSALSSIVEFSTNTTAKFVLGMIDLPLNGSIGFARFYSKPLLAADVTNNFDANRSRFGL